MATGGVGRARLKPDGSIKIKGASDDTDIGNTGDCLNVEVCNPEDIGSTPGAGIGVGAWNDKLVYLDMNVANGGVARDTAVGSSFTDLFSYTGSGLVSGWLVNCQTLQDWTFQFEIDGTDVFDTAGLDMNDMSNTGLYGFSDLDPRLGGIRRSGNIMQWLGPNDLPISYATSVKVRAKNPGNKKFLAGLIVLSKET